MQNWIESLWQELKKVIHSPKVASIKHWLKGVNTFVCMLTCKDLFLMICEETSYKTDLVKSFWILLFDVLLCYLLPELQSRNLTSPHNSNACLQVPCYESKEKRRAKILNARTIRTQAVIIIGNARQRPANGCLVLPKNSRQSCSNSY